MFLLITGICRVMTFPDRRAKLQQRIEALSKQRNNMRLLYTYHYSLRKRAASIPTGTLSHSHFVDPRHMNVADFQPTKANTKTVTEERLEELLYYCSYPSFVYVIT